MKNGETQKEPALNCYLQYDKISIGKDLLSIKRYLANNAGLVKKN